MILDPGSTTTWLPSDRSMTTRPPARVSISSPGAKTVPRVSLAPEPPPGEIVEVPVTLVTRASTVPVWANAAEYAPWPAKIARIAIPAQICFPMYLKLLKTYCLNSINYKLTGLPILHRNIIPNRSTKDRIDRNPYHPTPKGRNAQ